MLLKSLSEYTPKNTQEAVDKEVMIDFIKKNPDAFHRDNKIAHVTSSAIVVNETMDKVLFAYHNIYDSWSWVGGHNDGDPDCLAVALKEAKEETGIKTIRPQSDKIFMLDIIHVTNHYKNGDFVPDHLHLNVTYLLIGDENDKVRPKTDENQAVRWFSFSDALAHVDEPRMMPIYQKAFMEIVKIKQTF